MNLPEGLFSPPIAHRGLWRPGESPENSLAAFEIACQHRFGIELDVRLTADGDAVVFHDEALERMTGAPGRVAELTAHELTGLPLLGGPDRIPTLAQTLTLIDGRSMLLVEIKAVPDGGGVLEARVAELLDRYHGPAAVISFDPGALAWFAEHRPRRLRGLDALGLEDRPEAASMAAAFETARQLVQPHFLVLEKGSVMGQAAHAARAHGLPVIAWTVRSVDEAAEIGEHCDNFIFEGFTA